MELYFLDRSFAAVSPPIDTATSVVWSERLAECGTFAVELPLTMGAYSAAYTSRELLTLASTAAYLCDRQFCGRIETVICKEHTLHIGGRLLECLLYDRVASTDTVYSGTVGQIVLAAVRDWAGDLPLTLPDTVALGEDTVALDEDIVQVSMVRGEALGKWLHTLLTPLGAGYATTLTEEGTLTFSVYVGIDRSLDSADGVSRAIFSEDFGNIAGLETELYREDARDRLYVEGSDGTMVVVSTDVVSTDVETTEATEATEAATWRREGYAKASDIRPGQFSTTAAYQAALTNRGRELLHKYQPITRLTCIGEYSATPQYGVDYHLGDICEVQGDTWGVRCALRLTAVDVVYEGGTVKLYPFFGGTVERVRTIL